MSLHKTLGGLLHHASLVVLHQLKAHAHTQTISLVDVAPGATLNQGVVYNRFTLIFRLCWSGTGIMYRILISLLGGQDIEDRPELDAALLQIEKLDEVMRHVDAHGLIELISHHCHGGD